MGLTCPLPGGQLGALGPDSVCQVSSLQSYFTPLGGASISWETTFWEDHWRCEVPLLTQLTPLCGRLMLLAWIMPLMLTAVLTPPVFAFISCHSTADQNRPPPLLRLALLKGR